MIPICDRCDGDITASNLRWPGFCSAGCRDAASVARDADRRHRREVASWERRKAAGLVPPGTQAPWVLRAGRG